MFYSERLVSWGLWPRVFGHNKVKCFLHCVWFPIPYIFFSHPIKIAVENDQKEKARLPLPAPKGFLSWP